MATLEDLKQKVDRLIAQQGKETPVAYSLWFADDIKELDQSLTDTQVAKVLNETHRQRDASIGINWDVIKAHIEFIKGE